MQEEMQEQTTTAQSAPAQEVPETVSKTVKISMTKEQAVSWLSGVFNTPTTVIPTEQFPELIKTNLGLDVPEKFLGAFVMQMLNKPLTSRPRKEKPIEEPKPKREKAIKELFFQFEDTDVEVVSIKKEKPVDVVETEIVETQEETVGTTQNRNWQTARENTEIGVEPENEIYKVGLNPISDLEKSLSENPEFYTGSLGILDEETEISEETNSTSSLNTTEEDVNW
jgi:hypothetical protein